MSSEKKHITMFSSDGREFVVDEAVALQSVSIKNHVDEVGDRREIVVPDVTGPILEKVIEYCSKHAEEAKDSDEVKVWDAKFITVDQNVLFDLMLFGTPISSRSTRMCYLTSCWLQIIWTFRGC